MRKTLRFLWRCQPGWLRRMELALAANHFGKALDPKRVCLRGPAIVAGLLGTSSGLGEAARHMLREFQARGIPTFGANVSRFAVLEDFEAGPLWPQDAPNGGSVIFHINPDILSLVMRAIGHKNLRQRKIIGCWAWELEVVPQQWIRTLRYVDEVWAPSRFIADAIRKVAPEKPVHVLPYPMDIAAIPTVPLHDPLPEFAGKTIVYFMYDVRSTHARKNPEAVIEAFRRSNPPEDAVLIIKLSGASAWPEALMRLQTAIAGQRNIHILQKLFSPDDMRDVMARVDIVVSLHRSEGFGFLMAEAMAAAKPVIATGYSSNLDFMTGDCSVLVDYRLVPVVDPQNTYNKYKAFWAEPDVNQAAAALSKLLRDPAERQRMGQAARTHISQYAAKENWFASLPQSFWDSLPEGVR